MELGWEQWDGCRYSDEKSGSSRWLQARGSGQAEQAEKWTFFLVSFWQNSFDLWKAKVYLGCGFFTCAWVVK